MFFKRSTQEHKPSLGRCDLLLLAELVGGNVHDDPEQRAHGEWLFTHAAEELSTLLSSPL